MKTIKVPRFLKSGLKAVLPLMVLFIFNSLNIQAQENDSLKVSSQKHSIQVNALEVLARVYSVVYLYEFSPKNKIMLGAAYENINYDFGQAHALALIVGYRRYIWKGFNVEYALWPAYNSFYEKNENKYYNGLELWSEFRAGYDFKINFKKIAFAITPQLLLGKGLIAGNKPQSFIDYGKNEEPYFLAGNIAFSVLF